MQMPIRHAQTAVGQRSVIFVMGNNDKGGASFLAQLGHQLIEDAAVLVVEVAAWLVGKHQLGVVHQGTGNGDSLLFAAGEL